MEQNLVKAEDYIESLAKETDQLNKVINQLKELQNKDKQELQLKITKLE